MLAVICIIIVILAIRKNRKEDSDTVIDAFSSNDDGFAEDEEFDIYFFCMNKRKLMMIYSQIMMKVQCTNNKQEPEIKLK